MNVGKSHFSEPFPVVPKGFRHLSDTLQKVIYLFKAVYVSDFRPGIN